MKYDIGAILDNRVGLFMPCMARSTKSCAISLPACRKSNTTIGAREMRLPSFSRLFACSCALLFVLILGACALPASAPTMPARLTLSPPPRTGSTQAPLPDLTIPAVALEMQGRQGGCVATYAPYAIRVTVENIGSAGAPPFSVQLNQDRQFVKDGLRAGQRIQLEFTRLDTDGRYAASVDSSNQVAETDEENNARSYQAPTPTPPPLCTAGPTQTETPSPGG